LNLNRFKRKELADIVALDFGKSALKAVRIRNAKDGFAIVDAALLPPLSIPDRQSGKVAALDIPKHLNSNYAAVALSAPGTVAKLINLPQQPGAQNLEAQIREQFGVGDDYRIETDLPEGVRPRSGRKVLAAAMPEAMIANMLAATQSGPPAPRSCEISALAALTAYRKSSYAQEDDASCFIEIGEDSTYIFFTLRDKLLFLRKYDSGSGKIVESIINDFHVDRQTAANIMAEGAIDLSQLYSDALGFLVRQAAISRDFVERQESCSIGRIILSGGVASAGCLTSLFNDEIGLETKRLDPFGDLGLGAESIDREIVAQAPRFTAAVGAGIGEFKKE